MYNGKSGQHPAAVERSKRRAEYGLAPQVLSEIAAAVLGLVACLVAAS
jgi:hypothetical protein